MKLNQPSDNDLLLMLQRKDEKAFNRLYDMYAPSVYGLIMRHVQNESLAAEILKATFINLWKECTKPQYTQQRIFTRILSMMHKTALNDFSIHLPLAKQVNAMALT